MKTMGLFDFTAPGKTYIQFLSSVLVTAEEDYPQIEHLIQMMQGAHAIHIFGFGRSGCAALAFVIRLKQFCNYLPRYGGLGIRYANLSGKKTWSSFFQARVNRPEVNIVAEKTQISSASLVLITAAQKSTLRYQADIVLVIPSLQAAAVFGGGDFELGAFFLQEILVTYLGKKLKIPRAEVALNHV